MLVPLVAGQFALEAALADLAGADASIRDQLRNQLSRIAGLRQQIGAARGGALDALRAEVSALASTATAAAQEARTSAATGSCAASATAALALAARGQVTSVMAGMKDFNAYLHFGPGDTEAEYREREAERRALAAAEVAKGTPQGDLNASGVAVGQMADAKAHGAGDSPEFQKRWDDLVATTERLREAAKADGISTEEFDRRLREDLRRILKSKGLSDAQIDARFDATPDPLEAAKAYVKGDDDTRQIGTAALRATHTTTVSMSATPTAPTPELDASDAIANLQRAGVTADADLVAGQQFDHGVATRLRAATVGRTAPG